MKINLENDIPEIMKRVMGVCRKDSKVNTRTNENGILLIDVINENGVNDEEVSSVLLTLRNYGATRRLQVEDLGYDYLNFTSTYCLIPQEDRK